MSRRSETRPARAAVSRRAADDTRLAPYRSKRVAGATPEPGLGSRRGRAASKSADPASSFVVQLHFARRRHYDFRLEHAGTLRSWAIPKGPSLDPSVKRLAVEVEDHPAEYGGFEGSIPEGHYGAGEVSIWDRGVWQPTSGTPDVAAALAKGHLDFELRGERLRGAWALIRTRTSARQPQWLLIKQDDAAAVRGDVADETPLDAGSGAARAGRRAVASPKTTKGAGRRAAGRAAAFPDAVELPLAQRVATAPAGDQWLHEIKFDGYRVLLFRNRRQLRIESRHGIDYTARLPEIAEALAQLVLDRFVLDGELVALDEDGRTRFGLLQQRLRDGGPLTVMLFDLPYLDGRDLRAEPLNTRKALLARLRLPADGPLRIVDTHAGDGAALFAASCEAGLEGLVCKARSSPYRGGRSGDWLKLKCVDSAEFAVVGYTPGKGARRSLGSLLLAVPAKGRQPWRYVGRVGSGFEEAMLEQLGQRLKPARKPVALDAPPTSAQLLGAVPVWVAPRLVVEVEFRGWTPDGKLRQAAFKTIRDDRRIADLRDAAGPAPPAPGDDHRPPSGRSRLRTDDAAADAALGRFTHPERLLFEDPPITKAEIGAFYRDIADRVLPELVRRPLSLLRCPQGVGAGCFFQKHLTPGFSDAVKEHATGRRGERLPYIEDLSGLLGLVQMDVIEFHPWGARIEDVDRPDRLVFDLDPAPDVAWRAVVAAARELRERLTALRLECFVRTSGGKGLHVVVPLSGRDDWGSAKSFAQAMARTLAEESPRRYIDVATKSRRRGRIFIDYLSNGRGATSVASYSLRARPGAPLAVPIGWNELGRIRSGAQFGFANLRQRLARVDDPWRGIADVRQALPRLP